MAAMIKRRRAALQRQLDSAATTHPNFMAQHNDAALKMYRTVLTARIEELTWALGESPPNTPKQIFFTKIAA